MTFERNSRLLINGEIQLSNDSDATYKNVARCIISIRPIRILRPCTYLLTYIVDSGRIKPAISPKRLKIKRRPILSCTLAFDCRQNV